MILDNNITIEYLLLNNNYHSCSYVHVQCVYFNYFPYNTTSISNIENTYVQLSKTYKLLLSERISIQTEIYNLSWAEFVMRLRNCDIVIVVSGTIS